MAITFKSVFGGLAKAAVPLAGMIPGIGGVVGKVAGGLVKTAAKHPVATTIATGIGGHVMGGGGFGPRGGGLTLGGQIRRILPGGVDLAGKCPSGYHPARDGSGKCVRNRRLNPLNPRALSRALRRAEGFEKFARRTVTALHRGPAKFKKRTRKRR